MHAIAPPHAQRAGYACKPVCYKSTLAIHHLMVIHSLGEPMLLFKGQLATFLSSNPTCMLWITQGDFGQIVDVEDTLLN